MTVSYTASFIRPMRVSYMGKTVSFFGYLLEQKLEAKNFLWNKIRLATKQLRYLDYRHLPIMLQFYGRAAMQVDIGQVTVSMWGKLKQEVQQCLLQPDGAIFLPYAIRPWYQLNYTGTRNCNTTSRFFEFFSTEPLAIQSVKRCILCVATYGGPPRNIIWTMLLFCRNGSDLPPYQHPPNLLEYLELLLTV